VFARSTECGHPVKHRETPPCYAGSYSQVQLCTSSWYAMGSAKHRMGESGLLALYRVCQKSDTPVNYVNIMSYKLQKHQIFTPFEKFQHSLLLIHRVRPMCSLCLPCCCTTRVRRRRHSSMLRSMNAVITCSILLQCPVSADRQ